MRSLALIAAATIGLAPVAATATEVAPPRGGPIYEAIVLDAETGQVLRELNPDAVTYPASLTKMMTLYLTFEALNQGRLRLDQYLQVSAEAAAHKPSKLGLTPGEPVLVRDLILGVVTRSANDAAAVLAEGLGGTETNFAAMMTRKARQLGMARTQYHNASGLPDPGQLTTARDIARLALALYHDFPREYRYFSVREFQFQGDLIHSHDHLLEWYDGADGIKTGYTVASGFNLATSAVRNGHRLIGVIMGGQSARTRDEEMAKLLDVGFADVVQAPVMVQRQAPAAPIVVAAQPRPNPPASSPTPTPTPQPRPTFAAVAAASMAPAIPAPTPQPKPRPTPTAEPEHERPSIAAVASAAVHHLSPVSKAEAAPMAAEAAEAWGIQIGAFRAEAAAKRAERKLAHLTLAKGKQPQILAPASNERNPLYRVRLMRFSEHAAHAACDSLHKEKLACTVIRASGVKLATR
ncbi:MAG TPA: D-alanyl-D-alanine carboxypeptidase family protein [Stellaceae bacterium]|nr:D-alanyl-D-alanine carboxypeptidase family protein [Stellaceae bacterium]